MGFLQVSQEAIDKSLKCSDGWAEFVIKSYKEEKSKNVQKPSINYNFDLECDVCPHDAKNVGRHTMFGINSLAVMMNLPALMWATMGVKQEDIQPGNINLDSFVGKRVLCEIGKRPGTDGKMYEGQVLQMMPIGTDVGQPF